MSAKFIEKQKLISLAKKENYRKSHHKKVLKTSTRKQQSSEFSKFAPKRLCSDNNKNAKKIKFMETTAKEPVARTESGEPKISTTEQSSNREKSKWIETDQRQIVSSIFKGNPTIPQVIRSVVSY